MTQPTPARAFTHQRPAGLASSGTLKTLQHIIHEPQARPGAGVISCMLMFCFAPVVRVSDFCLRAHVRQHLRDLGARHALDVILIFE